MSVPFQATPVVETNKYETQAEIFLVILSQIEDAFEIGSFRPRSEVV